MTGIAFLYLCCDHSQSEIFMRSSYFLVRFQSRKIDVCTVVATIVSQHLLQLIASCAILSVPLFNDTKTDPVANNRYHAQFSLKEDGIANSGLQKFLTFLQGFVPGDIVGCESRKICLLS